MKVNITMNQMWANPSVRNFFTREQAERELRKLMDIVVYSGGMTDDEFFDIIEDNFEDYDDFEEVLYSETTVYILSFLGLDEFMSEPDEEDED